MALLLSTVNTPGRRTSATGCDRCSGNVHVAELFGIQHDIDIEDALPVGTNGDDGEKVPVDQRCKSRLAVDGNEPKLELVTGFPVNTGSEARDLLRAMDQFQRGFRLAAAIGGPSRLFGED